MPTDEKARIAKEPLAFSKDKSKEDDSTVLIAATSRLILETSDRATLNIEIFDTDKDIVPSYILLFLPGVCESAETKGIQYLFEEAKQRKASSSTSLSIRIAVLESLGHGISSGTPCLCPDFDQLVGHILEAATLLQEQFPSVPLFLSGNSMGGALAVYAAETLSNNPHSKLIGVAPVAPAAGVDPKVVPPSPLVLGLNILAYVAPSSKLSLTPYEDPSHYSLPMSTQRNYTGHWPLATSKMLLDLTSTRFPGDVEKGLLALPKVPNVLVLAAEKDQAVPLSSIERMYENIACPKTKLVVIPKAGHDLLFQRKPAQKIVKELFDWMEQCLV